jgi:DNA-binding NarL/FixJ family response regulator
MGRPRVLLAEDHPPTARALCTLLEPEFDVAAVVGDGHALLREAEAIRPDVVITDISMPGLDGIAATSLLLARRPHARVVLVTVHDDPELVERGYAAGALAYVTKDTVTRDLVPAVRTALRGERYPFRPVAPASEPPPFDDPSSGREGDRS